MWISSLYQSGALFKPCFKRRPRGRKKLILTIALISQGVTRVSSIATIGYSTTGTGGGTWVLTDATGVASQSPAQRGSATLTDPDGRVWEYQGVELNPLQLGAVMDGITDNTLVTTAWLDWTRKNPDGVIGMSSGVYLSGQIQTADSNLRIKGSGTTIKSTPETDGPFHAISFLNESGVICLSNLTIDHNRDNKTLGHCIRLGGSAESRFDDLNLINGKEYGIGVQAGTNLNPSWNNINIDTMGRDGIDIKNRNFDNDTFKIDGLTVRNHALDTPTNAAFDCRGQVELSNATFYLKDNAYGLRTRHLDSTQGPGGGIVGENFKIIATETGTNCIAVDFGGNTPSIVTDVSNIEVSGVALALRTQTGTTGKITGMKSVGINTGDSVSLNGDGWDIEDFEVTTTGQANRAIDFESGANNISVNNFVLTNGAGSSQAVRINGGAANISLTNGSISSGSIGDAGTNTTINNVT